MYGNYFDPVGLTICGISFSVPRNEGGHKLLHALFLHVRQGETVEEVNAFIRAKGLRPMSAEELDFFFKLQSINIEPAEDVYFLSTAPDGIKDAGGGARMVPAIFRKENGLARESASFLCDERGTLISDFRWIALVVDESRTMVR